MRRRRPVHPVVLLVCIVLVLAVLHRTLRSGYIGPDGGVMPSKRAVDALLYDLSIRLAGDDLGAPCVRTSERPAFTVCLHRENKMSGSPLVMPRHGVWNWPPASLLLRRVVNDTFDTRAKLANVTFVDVGAGVGFYTMLALALGVRHAVAFEPSKRHWPRMHKASVINHFARRLHIVRRAVDRLEASPVPLAEPTTARWRQRARRERHRDVPAASTSTTPLPWRNHSGAVTLDGSMALVSTPTVILRIDVAAGAECAVLLGAKRFFRALSVPFVFVHWRRRDAPSDGCAAADFAHILITHIGKDYRSYSAETGERVHFYKLDRLKWEYDVVWKLEGGPVD